MTSTNFLLSGLTILFVGLKLTDNVDWSWFWVLSPILIPIIAAVSILMGIAVFAAVLRLKK